MPRHTVLITLLAACCLLAVAAGPAAAENHDDDDGPTIDIDIDIGAIVDAIQKLTDSLTDFTGNFAEIATDILFAVFFQPFLTLLEAAADMVVGLMVWLPDTTIDDVLTIHRQVYILTLLLGAAGFSVIGLVYMGYDPFGIPYAKVRPLIPKLLAALVFGGIAPWLLNYPVRLTEMAAAALAPPDPSLTGLLMLSGELIIVSVVEAFIILALLVVFWVQKLYILFAAATAPLIALLWALPFRYTQATAERLIGAFWGFLLIGPLDIIVFRLTVAMLSLESFDAATWTVGLGGTFLMLGLPFMVVSSGIGAAAPALAMSRRTASAFHREYESPTLKQVRSDVTNRFGFDADADRTDSTRSRHGRRPR